VKIRDGLIGLIVLSVYLFGCSPTAVGNLANQEQTTEIPEPTRTLPKSTAAPKPTATEKAENSNLESVMMGGDFSYASFVLTYHPMTWKVIQVEEGNMEYQTLTLIEDPNCKIKENIPRGLPFDLTLEEIEEEMGNYSLSLAKWSREGEFFYGVFNFEEQNISIAVQPGLDSLDSEKCFQAAWIVIERSANLDFK